MREPENAEKRHAKRYNSSKCGGASVQPIVMIFGTDHRDIADIINRATFCIDRFKGFGLRKGQMWVLP